MPRRPPTPREQELEVQLGQLKSTLAASERLRAAAEREYRTMRDGLWKIAEALVPRELDQARQEDHTVDRWDAERLIRWIVQQGQARIRRLEALSRSDLGDRLAEARAEIERLTARLNTLTGVEQRLAAAQAEIQTQGTRLAAQDDELTKLRIDVKTFRDEVGTLRKRLEAARTEARDAAASREQATTRARPTPAKPADDAGGDEDDWMVAWKNGSGFDQDRALLRVMGFQGFCLRASIEAALVRDGVVTGSSRSVMQRLLDRLGDKTGALGLLEAIKPPREISGGSPFMYRLTDEGRHAFRVLFGEEPVVSEYDRLLARHKSAEHVLLNLRARDLFLERGAEAVDLYPQTITLTGGGQFAPDLVVVLEGKSLYVECERGGPKQVGKERVRKWNNYAAVSSEFYVVVPNNGVQSQLVEELDFWSYRHNPRARVTLRICNLSKVKDGPLWTLERQLGGWDR